MLNDDLNKMIWINPYKNNQFVITGFLSDSRYLHIPDDKIEAVTKENAALFPLLKHTSGGMVRFHTDSKN